MAPQGFVLISAQTFTGAYILGSNEETQQACVLPNKIKEGKEVSAFFLPTLFITLPELFVTCASLKKAPKTAVNRLLHLTVLTCNSKKIKKSVLTPVVFFTRKESYFDVNNSPFPLHFAEPKINFYFLLWWQTLLYFSFYATQ